MTKRMTSIRLSEHTQRQIADLGHIGSQSEIIALAIDRLHREEVSMKQRATATLTDGTVITGWLTTEHPASSYGKPVFVDDAGNAYDSWQIASIT